MNYVALIRGINVGGHNRVNMKVLRDAMEKNSFSDVRTYIQSGNIVFRSRLSNVQKIETAIIRLLQENFNVTVSILVRDEKEWARTVKRNPFLKETDDHTKLLVTFLHEKPAAADVKVVSAIEFKNDEFAIDGKDIYLHCRQGYGKSDVPNMFFEKKLKAIGTTRNWRTVLELEKLLASGG
jgi:uncharacterized protein (DUF1697 family)